MSFESIIRSYGITLNGMVHPGLFLLLIILMKKNIKMIWIVVIACILCIAAGTGIFLLHQNTAEYGGSHANTEKVTSFEIITLHLSGMRGVLDYEIVNKGVQSDVCQYSDRYENGERQKELEKCVSVDTEMVLQILNDCSITAWDGFHGKHPWGVKDGTMFTFTARVNDGREIHAEGSQNFPPKFQELKNWIYHQLKQK
ncbi:MAG: hypothetical protein J6A01_02470 [Proteobacteria bacterium]|nr:hypothetical protein [Pseudomonadota bacterium]